MLPSLSFYDTKRKLENRKPDCRVMYMEKTEHRFMFQKLKYGNVFWTQKSSKN